MKTIVVGDVHACLDELKTLLMRTQAAVSDRVILAGDIVDRGPLSVQTVQFARREGFDVLMGNHEEKHVRYERHTQKVSADPAYKNPMRMRPDRLAEHNALSADDHAWMANLPVFFRLEHEGRQWIINHAGVPSDMPIERQNPKLLVRCRTVHHDTGAYLSGSNPYVVPPGAVYWATRWSGTESVVHGHIVHKDFVVRKDVTPNGAVCLGIDTGCCFGGALTAVVFHPGNPDPEILSVPARMTYAQLRDGDTDE